MLFQSAARAYGPSTVGILMTGMGRDGVEGCKRILAAGGTTLGQDEATSVVYGMNKAAHPSKGPSPGNSRSTNSPRSSRTSARRADRAPSWDNGCGPGAVRSPGGALSLVMVAIRAVESSRCCGSTS